MDLEATLTEPVDEGSVRKTRWWLRWRETDAGQTLVEFSLILPLMLVMLFALVDFGRGFYTWLVITNAAREGARAGATQQSTAEITTRVYGAICDGNGGCGLDKNKLAITVTNAQGDRGETVDVALKYDFDFVTPIGNILVLMGGSSLSEPTISAHASMRLE
jgi:Flp pilus assembly protein TadG